MYGSRELKGNLPLSDAVGIADSVADAVADAVADGADAVADIVSPTTTRLRNNHVIYCDNKLVKFSISA